MKPIAIGVFLLSTLLPAQTMVTLDNSLSSQRITLAPYTAAAFPGLAGEIKAQAIPYTAHFSVLTNGSNRGIVGITSIWSYTSISEGKPKRIIASTDSYLTSTATHPFTDTVPAGASKLIAPIPQVVNRLGDAKDLKLTIDAVIFSDGQIVGPDTQRLGDDITSRSAAAHDVALRMRAAQLKGAPLASVSSPGTGSWGERYRSRVLDASTRGPQVLEAFLRFLETLPVPGAFHR